MGKPKIGIVDVPFSKGQRKKGVTKGPKAMRDAHLLKRLKEYCKADVKDYGTLKVSDDKKSSSDDKPDLPHYDEVINWNKQLAKLAESIHEGGRACLTLGGDHSIGFGSISGHCKAKHGKVALIWVDAHADVNTDATSDSGNMHGMPVAFLVKEMQAYWKKRPKFSWHKPCLSFRNMAYIGLRAIDPYEEFFISKFGITVFDMEDVQTIGMKAVVTNALKKIDPNNDRSIHLSFDIDAVDPEYAGSTGTPVTGGLLVREAITIATTLYETGRLGAIDLVEVNPELGSSDLQEKTVDTACEIITAAFGGRKRGVPSDLTPLKPFSK